MFFLFDNDCAMLPYFKLSFLAPLKLREGEAGRLLLIIFTYPKALPLG
jgi:hypothetical protein